MVDQLLENENSMDNAVLKTPVFLQGGNNIDISVNHISP